MNEIIVEPLDSRAVESHEIEMVERKGRGHPDYIADGASEAVSRALCKYYRKEFGKILHHNVDKGLVVGGRANPRFGGGKVEKPIKIIVAGRAVTQVMRNNDIIDVSVDEIARDAVKEFLRENFRYLNPEKDIEVTDYIRQGSDALVKIFDLSDATPLSNDTSLGVSYFPLSTTERLVLEAELYLNSSKLKKELPEVGEDIKVVGLRRGRNIKLTIAAPLISSLTTDLGHYLSVKEDVKEKTLDLAAKLTENYEITVQVNAADNPAKGVVYLTVTGTSAEAGDDGNTGRGNRVNGLITPSRQMSLEATAGKNPVSHVGKIYNVLAKLTSEKIYHQVPGIEEVYVRILSQIGKPINEPMNTSVQLIMEKGKSVNAVKRDVEAIIVEDLVNIQKITDLIIDRKVTLF